MPYPVKLEECTWPEIQAAIKEGYDTVIIPAGSVEQHGPHLPLLTDALIGEALSARIAQKLGRAFSAPVLRPALSPHHMAFPGSLTLRPDTFTAALTDTCLSLAEHGFSRLVLISSHGGNFGPIARMAESIQEAVFENEFHTIVTPYVDLEQYVRWSQDFLVDRYGGSKLEISGHADMAETALVLALRPDLVHMDKAEPGWMGNLFEVEDKIFGEGLQSVTSNGILGDPRRATSEMGRALLDYLSEMMTREIRATLCRR